MKAWHRLRDHAGELATGRPAPPQTQSAVPAEAEVLASIHAARQACADCPSV